MSGKYENSYEIIVVIHLSVSKGTELGNENHDGEERIIHAFGSIVYHKGEMIKKRSAEIYNFDD